MPNNKRRTFQRPTSFPYEAIVRESGGISVVRSDIATIVVKNANGSEDKPTEVHSLGLMTEKQAEPILKNIKIFDLNKYSKGLKPEKN